MILEDDNTMKFFSEDCQNDVFIGIYEWHDAMLYPSGVEMAIEWDRILTQTIGEAMDAEHPLSSLVFFWTSFATIEPFAYEVPSEEESDEESEETRDQEHENRPKQRTEILKGANVIRQLDKGLLVNGTLEPKELKAISLQLKSSEVDLIYIGHSSTQSGKWCFLLVSWNDGIARRILPQVLFHIDAENWEAGCTGRKLVVLG